MDDSHSGRKMMEGSDFGTQNIKLLAFDKKNRVDVHHFGNTETIFLISHSPNP